MGDAYRVSGAMMEELHKLRNERHRLEDHQRMVDRRSGELAEAMISQGHRKGRVAETLGVSIPHVGTLIERAREWGAAGPMKEVTTPAPVIPYYEAHRYLQETGAELAQVIVGREGTDVVLESGQDPDYFSDGLDVLWPNMLWFTSTGRVLVIDGVNSGYGGTGPGHTRDLLLQVGFDAAVADLAYAKQLIRIDIEDIASGQYEVRTSTSRGLPAPRVDGEVYAVSLGRGEFSFAPDPGDPGDPNGEAALTPFRAWIDYLDYLEGEDVAEGEDLPDWLSGERVARVFLDREEAVRQGFDDRSNPVRAALEQRAYVLVIEQGRLQLRLPDYQPVDPTQPVSDEAYEALAYAGLYPEGLEELTPQARFVRYWRRLLGNPRPGYIDISASGKRRLSYVPRRSFVLPFQPPDAPVQREDE